MSINTFAKMIERMEDLILAGMGIPFTPWTVVHGEKLVPLLDRIRETLPEEVQHAHKILNQREEIIADAQQKAQQVMQEAKTQAEIMLSESELLRAVHAEADRVRHQIMTEVETMRKKAHEESEATRAQAYAEARQVREGADQYAEAILTSLERNLNEFQTVVKNGQKYLKRARAEAMQNLQQQQRESRHSGMTQAQTHPQPIPSSWGDEQPPAQGGSSQAQGQTSGQKRVEDFLKNTNIGV